MIKEKRLVPIRRFEDFKDNWKQHRLEEIVSFLKGRNLSWADINEEGVNECILYGNLYTDYGMVIQSVNYSTNTSILGKTLSEYGDVLIPSSDTTPTGLARAASLEKDNVILGGDINVLRPNSGIKGSFLSYNINYNRNQLLKLIKGTTVKHIYNSDLKYVKIKLPSFEEQKHLSKFFKTMDNLINLQKQKITKLKDLKSGYLNDMFPKEGETVPKLRFAGFIEDWKIKTFADYGYVAMNKRIFKDQTSDKGDIPFYKIGTFGKEADAYISREIFNKYKSKYSYPNVGDILISASGSIGRTVEYKGEDEYFQDSNIVWLNHGGNIDNSFLKQFYIIVNWMGLEGSTIKRLYNSNILNTEIRLPSLKEQIKIGKFFRNLDNQIKIQEDKLEKLKQMKQAYLNEMFV